MDKQELEKLMKEGMEGIPASIKTVVVPMLKLMGKMVDTAKDKDDFFRIIDGVDTFEPSIKEGIYFKNTSFHDFFIEGMFWDKKDYCYSIKGNYLYSGFIVIISQKGIAIKDNYEDTGTVLATELKKQLEKALNLVER